MKIKKKRYYNSNIAVDVFYNPKIDIADFKKAAVCISGFPDFVGINPLTQLLVGSNVLVFQPHMAGTFDSGYSFNPEGAIRTFIALNDLINNANGSDMPSADIIKMPWNIDSVLLTGHSFGGFFVLRFFNLIENIEKILFTSSVLHYAERFGCLEIGPEQYEKVSNQYPFTYRLADISEWMGMWEGKDKLPLTPLGKVREVIIIYGENDKYFNIELVKQNLIELVKSYIISDNIEIKIVKEVGHPLIELLDNSMSQDSIKKLVL